MFEVDLILPTRRNMFLLSIIRYEYSFPAREYQCGTNSPLCPARCLHYPVVSLLPVALLFRFLGGFLFRVCSWGPSPSDGDDEAFVVIIIITFSGGIRGHNYM